MKYCSKCGSEFKAGSKFCDQCGHQPENLNKEDKVHAQAKTTPVEVYEKTKKPILSKSKIMKKIIAIAFTFSTFTIALVSFYFAIKGPETNTFYCEGELMADSYSTVLDEANTMFFLPLSSIMFFMSLYLLVISFKETK
tara:strand:+ start:65 stop:481 length:417 start_codon:yes stop_codon:yes gene_type:complete